MVCVLRHVVSVVSCCPSVQLPKEYLDLAFIEVCLP